MQLTPAQKRTLTWVGIALAGALLLWLLAPVLAPFVLAGVLAYVLRPAAEWLARKARLPRWLAVLLVELLAILVALATLLLIVPILSKELPLLREQIPVLAARANERLSPWLAQFGIHVALDVESLKAFVLKYLNANFEEWLGTILSSARIGGSFLLAILGNAVLVPVVLFYLMLDWDHLVGLLHHLVPPRMRQSVREFTTECDYVLGQYLRGQLMVMAIMAVYYSVGLALFGFDLAVPVGVFTGIAMFIPYLGFGIGLVLALLAGVLQFASLYGVLAVVAVFGLGQVLESFLLTPRLVGERIGLHPITVIFALLAFGHLLGFVGVLIALPLSAIGLVAALRLKSLYLGSRLYSG